MLSLIFRFFFLYFADRSGSAVHTPLLVASRQVVLDTLTRIKHKTMVH